MIVDVCREYASTLEAWQASGMSLPFSHTNPQLSECLGRPRTRRQVYEPVEELVVHPCFNVTIKNVCSFLQCYNRSPLESLRLGAIRACTFWFQISSRVPEVARVIVLLEVTGNLAVWQSLIRPTCQNPRDRFYCRCFTLGCAILCLSRRNSILACLHS